MKLRFWFGGLLLAVGFQASGAVRDYAGVNNGGVNSEIVSGGSLRISGDVNTPISFTFTRGGTTSATMNNFLVLFLDSTSGGFANTVGFSDRSSESTRAISGLSSSGTLRATANFATGFGADYAVVINPNVGAWLYQLGSSEHTRLDPRLSPTGSGNQLSYSFTIGRDSLGMSGTDTLRFQSTYVAGTGFRTLESFERLTGTEGHNEVNFNGFNIFDVQPVPEMTNVALAGMSLFVGGGFALRVRRFFRMKRTV